jgi:fimbrial chaperone protein
MKVPFPFRAALAGALMLVPVAAHAGALRVTPVRVDIAPGHQFCALTVSNDGDAPVSVQVRGYGWAKDRNGTDQLDAATGPRVNPTILTLARGESGLVRCSVPPAADPAREDAWRLIVDELPTPAEPIPAGGVRALLRLSIPVFRTPAGAEPHLVWQRLPDGTLHLANTGRSHVQILGLTLTTPGKPPVDRPKAFYLLAAGEIDLPGTAPADTITARTADGEIPVARAAP